VRLFPRRLLPHRLRPGRRLHDLADAYALDALDDADRERFERHLRTCPACADDVRRYTEVATALAMAVAAEPPPALRERVLAAATVTRQAPPPVLAPRRRAAATRSPWMPRLAIGLAAAGVAAAAVLAVVQVSTQDRLNTVRAQNEAIAALLAAPDARFTSARSTVGGTAAVVLSASERKLVFISSGLPSLPASEVYQLWLIGPVKARSAGLLSQANGKTSPVLAAGVALDDKVGVTVEPAGGTSSPTTTPILAMTLPSY
jgi:anti-sigma-K factor RskA